MSNHTSAVKPSWADGITLTGAQLKALGGIENINGNATIFQNSKVAPPDWMTPIQVTWATYEGEINVIDIDGHGKVAVVKGR